MVDCLFPRRGDISLSALVLEDRIKNIQQVILTGSAFQFADDATLRFLESLKNLLPPSPILIPLCFFIPALWDQVTGWPCYLYDYILPLLLLNMKGKGDIIA